jgi:hypothetical protein
MSIPVGSRDLAPLTIGSATVAPGARARAQLDLVELADGARVKLPVVLINGARPGPRLYLGAAIHGDEVNGVAILSEALADLRSRAASSGVLCGSSDSNIAIHEVAAGPGADRCLDLLSR